MINAALSIAAAVHQGSRVKQPEDVIVGGMVTPPIAVGIYAGMEPWDAAEEEVKPGGQQYSIVSVLPCKRRKSKECFSRGLLGRCVTVREEP